ncbi:MAG: zinc-dependent metalloprotease, partial [Armatimonadota bacterium]
KPIPGSTKPEDEKQVLDAWASRQVDDPQLRFYDNFNPIDPTAQSEALGDDAVEASKYGTANLKRTMGFVESATAKFGDDYSELSRQYANLWGQFRRYVGHVSVVPGGVIQTDYHQGRGGVVYSPASKDYQRRSVQWLIDNTFDTPYWLIPNDIVMKVGPGGATSRVTSLQASVLARLFAGDRLNRMIENEAVNGFQAYTTSDLTEQVRWNVLRELSAPSVKVDAFRRGLQRAYVNQLIGMLASSDAESRGLALTELRTAQTSIKSGVTKAGDSVTRSHLEGLSSLITLGLTFPSQAIAQSGGIR